MKITKTELKEMIRVALREELTLNNESNLSNWVAASAKTSAMSYFLVLNYWITGAVGPAHDATADRTEAINYFNMAIRDAKTRARKGKITKIELIQFDNLSDVELAMVNSYVEIEKALKRLKYTIVDSVVFKTN